MRKLLSANFSRLWKSKVFWAEIVLNALLSVFVVIVNYSSEVQATVNRLYLEDVFFTMYQILGFILAAGISLIVGAEYSDGTIRNKLIIGKTRAQIYISNFIASAVPSCLVLAVHGVITFGMGYFLWGNFTLEAEHVFAALLSALLISFVFSALFVSISMNCSNKAVTAVVSLLLVLGLTYLAGSIGTALMEPQMTYDSITYTTDSILFGNEIPNPSYISGVQRTLYEMIYDLLPTGQLLQMYSLDFSRCIRWPVFSIVLFVVITAVGYFMFRKKNIN